MPYPKRNILVTSALPYANGSIHIGHLVEYIQTDIWVRFERLRGHHVTYVCGDDAHGTPVMLRARSLKLAPEAFIEKMNQEHREDFARFDIAFYQYYSTHSPENRTLCVDAFEKLMAGGHLIWRDVEQFYDPAENIFLPDRFIRGLCPHCRSPEQYGDSCEVCGKHYSPIELIEPRSAISGAVPIRKKSRHLFLRLENFRPQLEKLLRTGMVDASIANKLDEWFSGELKDWDISRDEPFFGFEIPGEKGKYFYNWLDAPIGYLASLAHLLQGIDQANEYWQNPDLEIHHFIGKDIVYFHALFWPAILIGSGRRLPNRLSVHGHLTVNGEKMSKSRGTFISAAQYARHMDPQWLRYYFATRLGPTPADLDLNFTDFAARVNSELVGKIANLLSRVAPMLTRLLDGQTGVITQDALALLAGYRTAQDEIVAAYEDRQFATVTRIVCGLADKANKFVEDNAPWSLVKRDAEAARGVLTAALECSRILAIYLKPIVPAFSAKVEACLRTGEQAWSDIEASMPPVKIAPFEHLVGRVDERQVQVMLQDAQVIPPAAAVPPTATSAAATSPEAAISAPAAKAPASGSGASPSADAFEPLAPACSIEQFAAVDLRVGKVVSAEAVLESDKLMRLELDAGPLGTRQILAGIKKAYAAENLIGRMVIFCANLPPRKMKFGTSEGMILAAGPGGSEVFVLGIDSGAKPGQRVH